MNNVVKAIKALRPNSPFSFSKDNNDLQVLDIDHLVWLDDRTEAPLRSEIEAEMARQEAEKYKELRSPEYPPLSDLADAIYWQSQGDDSKMKAYLAAVESVKLKYPKEQ